ncbi:MAG: GNAT family N-acetyltransferase [Atribacterota bacterium]|nr:GNAT family N-acetyltransferase [Atribacterota bacterium]
MASILNQKLLRQININSNFQYGDLGKVLLLHGQVYHQIYGFNHKFEAYVAEGLAEFARKYQKKKSKLWIVEKSGTAIGSIAILEKSSKIGQLRWFLVHPDYQGLKIGKSLLEEAIIFSKKVGYKEIFLWTLSNLETAKIIYEKAGFKLKEQKESFIWDRKLVEEFYILELDN